MELSVLLVTQPTLPGSLVLLQMLFLAPVDTTLMEATFANFAQPTIITLLPVLMLPMPLLAPQDSSFLTMYAMPAPRSILIG